MAYIPPHLSANKMKLTGAPGDFKFPSVENGIQVFGDTDLYGSFLWSLKRSDLLFRENLLSATLHLIYIY